MKTSLPILLLASLLVVLALILSGRTMEGIAAPSFQDDGYPDPGFVPTSPNPYPDQATDVTTLPSATSQQIATQTLVPPPGAMTATPSPTLPGGLTLTVPPPTATGPTPTLKPLPSITLEFPTPTRTPVSLASLSRPNQPTGLVKAEPKGIAALSRYIPLLFVGMVWALLGAWFYSSSRSLETIDERTPPDES